MPRFRARRRVDGRREPVLLSPRHAPAVPRERLAGAPRRPPRTVPWLVGSLLLHLLLAAVALIPDLMPRSPEELPAPSFEVVFEGGQPERPQAEPPPGLEAPPEVPAPQAPSAPPRPPAPPAVAAVEAVPPPPPPAPVPAPPSPPLAEAVPPPPAPDTPRPPANVELLPPSLPAPPPLAALPPPPPAPPVERPPQPTRPPEVAQRPPQPETPRPPQRQGQAAPAIPPGALFLPDGMPLGRPSPPLAAGRPGARGLDLNVDPRLALGRETTDPSVRVSGAVVGADWRAAFRRWLDQNIRYPRRAIELQESGEVRVRVVAGPDGQVRSVRLVGPSGSPSLNLGTTFPFEGARLPSFPPPTDPNGVTIDLTVNYILVRR